MTVSEIQMSGLMLMAALSITITVLSAQWGRRLSVSRTSGFMLGGAAALMAMQFGIQYGYQIRSLYGITTAAMVNLIFFMPVSLLINLSLLYLQRQQKITKVEWAVGPVGYVTMLLVLLVGAVFSQLQQAEYVAAAIFGLTQLYYNWLEFKEFRRINNAVERYLDPEQGRLINWTYWSMLLLTLFAFTLPFMIFRNSVITSGIYAILFFGTLYYYSISFICYNVSNAVNIVNAAELYANDAQIYVNDAQPTAADSAAPDSGSTGGGLQEAINEWVANRGYTQNSLSLKLVAAEMGITPRKLEAWVRSSDHEKFASWINYLRIEEACHIMTENPNYNNEAVAEACGFNSISYYLRTFRLLKGMKPSEWLQQQHFQR